MNLRPLRGRVLIRPEAERSALSFWTPPDNPRAVKIHRGEVVFMGPAACSKKGNELPPGFAVGDKVLYTWVHNEDAWTNIVDGEKLAIVPQSSVQGVIEP